MDDLLGMLDRYGAGLLFIVILLKEIGVPVPVPGDLLMVVAGARAAAGKMPLWAVLLAAFVGGVIGAYIQYALAKGPGRGLIYRFGKYVGLTPARLDKASAAISGRGWVGVALGRSLPGLRIGAVAACGLAAMPTSTFVGGLLVGTVLFVGFHTLLGFLAGPGVGAALSAINIPVWLLVIVLVVLGLVGWIWLRARARRKAAAADDEPGAVFDWADACCPACLAAARLAEGLQKTQSMPRPA